jgi:transcriptional regulator GlxA family with amidase domain
MNESKRLLILSCSGMSGIVSGPEYWLLVSQSTAPASVPAHFQTYPSKMTDTGSTNEGELLIASGKAFSILKLYIFNLSIKGSPSLPVNFGVIVFPGFQALDAFGPLDALNTLSLHRPLNLYVIAQTLDPVSTKPSTPNLHGSNFAQSIVPTHTFTTVPPLDVLIIPGGLGTNDPEIESAIGFVKKVYPSLQYLITVCTGAGVAARAGVLDGKRATTNKMSWASNIALRPEVTWIAHARWVVDGNIWTSSGVSAGLDAAFAFIGAVYGDKIAEKLADVLEYERHTDPSWDPFGEKHGLKDSK